MLILIFTFREVVTSQTVAMAAARIPLRNAPVTQPGPWRMTDVGMMHFELFD
jgi:hypothetical protein